MNQSLHLHQHGVKEHAYKIGNKDVRFYVNKKDMSLKDKSLVNRVGINKGRRGWDIIPSKIASK